MYLSGKGQIDFQEFWNVDPDSGGTDSHEHLRIQFVLFVSGAVYFLIREVLQLRAMYKLNLAKNWFMDFWNYIDILAAGGAIVFALYFYIRGSGSTFNTLASIHAMVMWMKVLGFAKAFSKQVATFILMLSQIIRDLRSFIAVLAVIITMFVHAFYLLMNGDSLNPDEWRVEITPCNATNITAATEIATNTATQIIDHMSGVDSIFNFADIGNTYFSLFLMLMGNLDEPSLFQGKATTYVLFILYTIIVYIVLLNVLIAIIGDSYDAVLVKSNELFWQARLELIAEISTVFDWFLVDVDVWESRVAIAQAGKSHPIWGLDDDHAWSNKNSKNALLLRLLFSPILVGFGMFAFLYNCLLAFLKFAVEKIREGTLLNELYLISGDLLLNIPKILTTPVYLINEDEFKLTFGAIIGTILALPITMTFSILLFVASTMTFITYIIFYIVRFTNRQIFNSISSGDGDNLKLKSGGGDWSGRVLDIVNRVSAKTSDEITKTNKVRRLESRSDELNSYLF